MRNKIYYLPNSIARIFLAKYIKAFIRVEVKSRWSNVFCVLELILSPFTLAVLRQTRRIPENNACTSSIHESATWLYGRRYTVAGKTINRKFSTYKRESRSILFNFKIKLGKLKIKNWNN